MPSFHSLRVSALERTTSDAMIVTFDVPADLKSSYAFVPGQYISLEQEIEDKHYLIHAQNFSFTHDLFDFYLAFGHFLLIKVWVTGTRFDLLRLDPLLSTLL